MFVQLTIDARDPALLAAFWRDALDLVATPPSGDETWWRHYRGRLEGEVGFDDRLFDPSGRWPPLWFQEVPEEKAGKNRLHLDLYVTDRDDSLSMDERERLVQAKVRALVRLGARVLHHERSDDPDDPFLHVAMQDPEGNEFCVA